MLGSLPPAEFECHVVVPAEPPLRAEYEATGAAVHIVPMARISRSHRATEWLAYAWAWPIVVARLVRLIRALDIDVASRVPRDERHHLDGATVAGIRGLRQ